MNQLPIISEFTDSKLNHILADFPSIEFLSLETRKNFSGAFPMHTRYFSNGDSPLVLLKALAGNAIFSNRDLHSTISAGSFIFFDDNDPHSWIFDNCDLEIVYYRLPKNDGVRVTHGDYCLDDFFTVNRKK